MPCATAFSPSRPRPTGRAIDPDFLKAHGQILEFEQDFILGDHPAHLREFGYLNTADMGKYRDALAEMPVDPDITVTRSYRNKYGFGVSCDKEITNDLGCFLRGGWNDGQTESWAFTEIDWTTAAGFLLKGRAWGRPQDQVGLAGVVTACPTRTRSTWRRAESASSSATAGSATPPKTSPRRTTTGSGERAST